MACFEEEVCVMSEIPPWVEESKRPVRVERRAWTRKHATGSGPSISVTWVPEEPPWSSRRCQPLF